MPKEYVDDMIILVYLSGLLLYFAMNIYYMIKLDRYLKKNFPEKWEYLTYVPPFGSGGSNPFRMIPFLFNKEEDYGDKKLRELKRNSNKSFLIFLLYMAVGAPGLMLVLSWVQKMIE